MPAKRAASLAAAPMTVNCMRWGKHLGLTAGMMVLNVTTSEQTQAKMIELALETSEGRGNSYLPFRTAEQFGRYFKPPKPMPELFEGEWARAGKAGFRIDHA
jgi:hypothetical protein